MAPHSSLNGSKSEKTEKGLHSNTSLAPRGSRLHEVLEVWILIPNLVKVKVVAQVAVKVAAKDKVKRDLPLPLLSLPALRDNHSSGVLHDEHWC